jgi:uncharacterized protein (TIGR02391 family)
MDRVEVFDGQTLEGACRILGHTERGLKGEEIGRLLQEIEVADVSPEMTKWKRIYNAMATIQNQKQVGNHLLMFIIRAMKPVLYVNRQEDFQWRRDQLNVILAFSGYFVRDDGRVGRVEKTTTIEGAKARAGRLKQAMESRKVHEEVFKYCRAELLDDNYFHSVFEATKGVYERIRIMANTQGDGADLVNKVFGGQAPIMSLNPLISESDRSEQKGFVNLLNGLYGAVRNPQSHAPKMVWPMSEEDALDILTLVSFIHRKLDRAVFR